MKIPLVDLKRQYERIKDEVMSEIAEVIEETSFILGPGVIEFEEAFARFCGAKYCVGVSSGTSALHLALIACGIKEGDGVITVPNTFIATTESITHTGARIRFVDIDPETYNIDVSKIEEAITEKTKAIIPVHLYGHPCDMDSILEIAKKYDLKVIEDACQAHGAEYRGQNTEHRAQKTEDRRQKTEDRGQKSEVRSQRPENRERKSEDKTQNPEPRTQNPERTEWMRVGRLGDIGCFSFYPGKNLGAYGDGGAVTTNEEEIAEKIRLLRTHGAHKKYTHLVEGYNYRLDGIQAAVLRVKLKYLDEWNQARRRYARAYNELLKDDRIITPYCADYARHVYHLYVIRTEDRDGLKEHLEKNEIFPGIHYPLPLHLQPAYEYLGHREGDFPVSEMAAKEILSLPMFAELKGEEIEKIAELIKDYLKRG